MCLALVASYSRQGPGPIMTEKDPGSSDHSKLSMVPRKRRVAPAGIVTVALAPMKNGCFRPGCKTSVAGEGAGEVSGEVASRKTPISELNGVGTTSAIPLTGPASWVVDDPLPLGPTRPNEGS